MRPEDPISCRENRTVVALGNFDGFHLGHQSVLARAMAFALQESLQLVVATFDPHPVRFFKPQTPGFLLTTIAQRKALLSDFGADQTVAMPFDGRLAALSPDDFVSEWLCDKLKARRVVTGANFKFGRNRSGNTAALRHICAKHGIISDAVDTFEACGSVASSTRVRHYLSTGDLKSASELMARPYVVHGFLEHRQIGGQNSSAVGLADYLAPLPGLYSARILLPNALTSKAIVEVVIPKNEDPPYIRFPDSAGWLGHDRQDIAIELISMIGKTDSRSHAHKGDTQNV